LAELDEWQRDLRREADAIDTNADDEGMTTNAAYSGLMGRAEAASSRIASRIPSSIAIAGSQAISRDPNYFDDLWSRRYESRQFSKELQGQPPWRVPSQQWLAFIVQLRKSQPKSRSTDPDLDPIWQSVLDSMPAIMQSSVSGLYHSQSYLADCDPDLKFRSNALTSYLLAIGQATIELPRMKQIDAILKRPWWQRVWAVQEYAVAHSPTFVLGNQRMTWDEMEHGLSLLRSRVLQKGQQMKAGALSTKQFDPPPRFCSYPFSIFDFRKRFRLETLGMIECLAAGCTYVNDGRSNCLQATNQRDKVYAFLGLVNHGGTGSGNI
jgi:hypothetical protein